MTDAPIISLVDLHTGEEIRCPLPADHAARYTVALGNFDGVHAAHRALLYRAARYARAQTELGIATHAAAFCFRTHSTVYIDPHAPDQITTLEEKLKLFVAHGIRYAFLADFPSLCALSPLAFMVQVLRDMCRVDAVCCGFNYRFGKNGSGDAATLRAHFGSQAAVLPCLRLLPDGSPTVMEAGNTHLPIISSSEIRSLLQKGDIETANAMLQRPYSLSGKVEGGKQLGRTIGFPTANLSFPPSKIVPAYGVYATLCRVGTRTYPAVSNVGVRPTVDAADSRANCETHLLHFDGDLYGEEIQVSFLKKLRSEQKFSSVEMLRNAIRCDTAAAIAYFSDHPANTTEWE